MRERLTIESDARPFHPQARSTVPPSSDAIRTESLVREFDGVRAVDGVDLRIPTGEIYGFLGPNGAGKSTTVHMLCTLLAPTGGRALVAGYDVGTEPAELIDLGDFLDRLIGTYSGGMKRRLDLAAALIHNPEVVFLDEPTTGLDPVSRVQVWSEVRRLNVELGITIFLTTQYLEEADELAHRVGIIDHGRIVAEGTPTDLKKAVGSDVIIVRVEGDPTSACPVLEDVPGVDGVEVHGSELVVSTGSGSATISPVAVALAGTDLVVRDLTLRTPTLDDVFLELTGTHIEPADTEEDRS